jgi:hypothetical protein
MVSRGHGHGHFQRVEQPAGVAARLRHQPVEHVVGHGHGHAAQAALAIAERARARSRSASTDSGSSLSTRLRDSSAALT